MLHFRSHSLKLFELFSWFAWMSANLTHRLSLAGHLSNRRSQSSSICFAPCRPASHLSERCRSIQVWEQAAQLTLSEGAKVSETVVLDSGRVARAPDFESFSRRGDDRQVPRLGAQHKPTFLVGRALPLLKQTTEESWYISSDLSTGGFRMKSVGG